MHLTMKGNHRLVVGDSSGRGLCTYCQLRICRFLEKKPVQYFFISSATIILVPNSVYVIELKRHITSLFPKEIYLFCPDRTHKQLVWCPIPQNCSSAM